MLEELTEKLDTIFRKLRGQGKLTEANIRDGLRDIRRALLEADVNFKVAKRFLKDVEQKALGSEVLSSISPAQLIVKIVYDEIITLLGGESVIFQPGNAPCVIVVCGLQGSGKTTSVVKLALYLEKKGKKVLVSSVDVHRPAAIEQLKVLADTHSIPFFLSGENHDPSVISHKALEEYRSYNHDILIMDTAGRLHVDDEMMNELSLVRDILKPLHILFVADGMTGQDAVNAVEGFQRYVEFDGVILTKMDGDARGGAALSIREVTGKPILFVGNGERIEAFEQFHPDRFASRILGMGDIVSLVEKAQEVIDERKARQLQEKMLSARFTLDDFLDQLQQIKKMGPLEQIIGMIPGIGKTLKNFKLQDDGRLKYIEAIIYSMTRKERMHPHIIDGSRRKRIAQGSGTTLQEVNGLLKQFFAMQKMMKKMSRMTGSMRMMQNFKMPLP